MRGVVGWKGADARFGLVVHCLLVAFAHQLAYAQSDESFPQSVIEGASSPNPSAASGEGRSPDEIARELANPKDSLASLTFEAQYCWLDGFLPGAAGHDNETRLFQPSFPSTPPEAPRGGKGKRLKIGRTPVELEAEINHYVLEPIPVGPECMLGLNIDPLIRRLVEG